MGKKDEGPLVCLDEDGHLVYQATSRGERILDFSHCGYQGGGVALPDATVAITLEPSPDDACAEDDTARIQAAIDQLGVDHVVKKDSDIQAILLKAGTWRIQGELKIAKSGIVLRGEGDDTVVMATGKDKRNLINISGGGPGPLYKKEGGGSFKITSEKVHLGETTFDVKHKGAIQVGDNIYVQRNTNMKWIKRLGMDQLEEDPKKGANNWKPESYVQKYERTVTHVDGDTVTVNIGIPCTIQNNFGGGEVWRIKPDRRISHCGVEHMKIVSEYEAGQEDKDEDHAWIAVCINSLRDGWVRNVTAVHFGYSCVSIEDKGFRITVQDCKYIDPVSIIRGGRRYSFNLCGQLCLMQRCYTRDGRHDYVNGSQVRGPNVFLDCVAESTHADCGPPHRWSVSTLYDNIRCRLLNVQNRGTSGTGHGWAGANMVLWNCDAEKIKCEHPPAAANFCIGCKAEFEGDGHFESKNEHVSLRSLYLVQLKERLGMDAVRSVATKEQYAFLE